MGRCGVAWKNWRPNAGVFGFRRLAVLLRREGIVVNIKRVLRVYREAHLQVRKRVKRRVALGRGEPAPIVSRMNERWSLDFVQDTLLKPACGSAR